MLSFILISFVTSFSNLLVRKHNDDIPYTSLSSFFVGSIKLNTDIIIFPNFIIIKYSTSSSSNSTRNNTATAPTSGSSSTTVPAPGWLKILNDRSSSSRDIKATKNHHHNHTDEKSWRKQLNKSEFHEAWRQHPDDYSSSADTSHSDDDGNRLDASSPVVLERDSSPLILGPGGSSSKFNNSESYRMPLNTQ